MKRKKDPRGFHKRVRSSTGNSSLTQSIRNTLQRGDYAAALTAIDQALVTVTDAGEQSLLLSLAGDCLFRQGKYAEAAETYGEVLEQVQEMPLFWLRPAIGQIHSLLKDVQVEAAQAQALAAMQRATDFYQQYQTQVAQAVTATANGGQTVIPAEPPTPATVAGRLGKIFFSEGEITTAKNLWQQAAQLDPGHVKALLGLAEIAVRENDAATAIAKARQALAANHYHAQTLSAWNILFAAGRLAGADVLDAALLTQLKSQAPAAVQARAILLIVKNLRAQGDARWQTLAANWLQTADTTGTIHKIVAAELRKLSLAHTRIANATAAQKMQRTQALLQTPGISPGEWLCATKHQVSATLAQSQTPDVDTLLAQGAATYGVALRPKFTHGLALACQKAGQKPLAKMLFQRNAADANASAEQQGKSLWALARLQSQQGDHAGAAQSFLACSENSSVPQRFQVFALVQWVRELIAAKQPDLLAQAKPRLEAVLPQIADYELVLDLARQVYASPLGHSTWNGFAQQIYQQGKQQSLLAFAAAGEPAGAIEVLFKFCRRANTDFLDRDTVIATWIQMADDKKLWLWSESEAYWNYLELVFRSYRDTGRHAEAEAFMAQWWNDPATPAHGIAILGNSYIRLKQQQRDWPALFTICTRMAKVAPVHEWTAAAYYWLALREWKEGDIAQARANADKLLLALGKNYQIYWKRDLAASALCLNADLDLNRITAQTELSADTLQRRLQAIQTDLGKLNS
jgi:tetratricopeptide (TPR) repeat protein